MADRAGRTQERQRLGATTFTQAFDGAWHPTSLTSSWVAPPIHPSTIFSTASSNGYFPTGQIHLATFGNGLTETNVYNNRLQPCRLNLNASATVLTNCSDRSPSTGNLLDFTNGFNWGTSDNGNVVSWNASGQQSFTRSFQYDSLNRLQQLTEAGGNAESCKPSSSSTNLYTISWTVDAWGNRTNQTPSQGTCSFSQAVNAKNQFVAGSYDAAGNLLGDGIHSYFCDAENRIVQVDGDFGNCSAATACYLYNANGQRVLSLLSSGSTTSYHLYGSDGQIVANSRS